MQYKITKQISASNLATFLELKFTGDPFQNILGVGSLKIEESNILKFASKPTDKILKGIVIGFEGAFAESLIESKNPRLDFCRALEFLIDRQYLILVNKATDIDSTAKIADSAVIESGVVIGANSVVEHNVTIHKGTIIGKNSIIRANSVIGAQGFGFEKDNLGHWVRFPHLGRVIIGNNVEIGALNSICVGAIDNTIICDGVKTDNLVHIAHNCHIGKNSILTACTELSGGVILGEGVWMGPNSATLQKINIDDNALVGIGSVVTKNVEKGHTVAGFPAKVLRKINKS